MKGLMVAILIAACQLTAFSQGIEFFHGTFQEALDKAKVENKKVFVDVYTSWCGPCKKMAKTVFTQDQVGTFYNQNFICIKIDAEKGEGPTIAKKYGVSGYPTLMYLNGNGDAVKKLTSGVDAPYLIELGKSVLTVNDNFSVLKKKFAANKLNKDELYQYLVLLQSKELSKEVAEVFGEYFALATKEGINIQLLNMIPEYASTSDSKAFQHLLKNRKKFNKAIGEEKVTNCINDFYLGEFKYTRYTTEDEYWTAKKVLASRIDIDEKLNLSLDVDHYNNTQNEDKYIEAAGVMINKYYSKDDLKISHVLGSIRYVRKKTNLLELEKWGMLAIELNDSFMNNVQLAMVYMALKDDVKSKKFFDKAEKSGKENNDPYLQQLPQMKEMFKQMFK